MTTDGQGANSIEQGNTQTESEDDQKDARVAAVEENARDTQHMKIQGSVRSNLISAITSARRWRGQPVHPETFAYWRAVLDCGRHSCAAPFGESVDELVAELENELAQSQVQKQKKHH